MALKTSVKVTINNLSDARYSAGMGVDYLGFSVDEDNEFYLSSESFKEIAEWISGVNYVAELSSYKELDNYNVEIIQVSDPELAAAYPDKKVILEVTPSELTAKKDQISKAQNISTLLINIDNEKEQLSSVQSISEIPCLIGYDLSPQEVLKLVESERFGIALKGSSEDRPGYKDYDELADILEELEVDEPY